MTTQLDPADTGAPLDEEERARAGVYGLLGALLASPPQPDLLTMLRDLEPGTGALAPAWQRLKLAAAQAGPERLEEEFNNLFIGLGRGELVPYGSWYLSGFLMEKPLAELRVGLQQLGYERQEGVAEPEDHVAALCEVMAMTIVENRLTFLEQAGFFAKHVGSWMPRFFQDLEKAESADFYRAVGSLGTHLMTVEQKYFAMSA
jgi:TorA maturation chaperone TorD